MNRFLLFALAAVVALGLLSAPQALAQRSNVTFLINTATVPDTILPTSNVTITGGTSMGDTILTNWGAGVSLTSIGGDYWQKVLSLQVGDTLNYKIKIYGGGWEENVNGPLANTNRNFIVPATDTALPVEFWNNGHFPQGKNIDQFDKPYTTVNDSFISVYFRVNIKGVQDAGAFGYTPADQDSVCVLGDGKGGPDLDWGTPFYLTQEQPPTNSGTAFGMPANTFYSGRLRFRKSQINPGDDIAYKFRFGSNWSYGSTQRAEQLSDPPYGGGNRHFTIPSGLQDTTLQWVYFSDTKPVARENPDTCIIRFNVDLLKATEGGGFSQGDTVQVQSGFFGTGLQNPRTTTLQLQIGSIYSVVDTIITKVGSSLDYQYYLNKNGQSIRENYYNFGYTGPTPSEAERRQLTVTSKNMVVNDTSNSVTSERRQPVFPNNRKLARQVRVKYEVDVRPAYYQIAKGDTIEAIQGNTNVYLAVRDSIKNWGVWINGPAVGGWGNPNASDWGSGLFNNLDKKMYDDGTHGDMVAGDTIYTMTILDSPDSVISGATRDVVGQVFKFGIYGSDNEAGSGGYGNNHSENIIDTDTSFTLRSQFGSINPAFYNAWDFDNERPATPSSVTSRPGIARVFALEQNYPNPFNPSTRIQFSIPIDGLVKMKVFNVLGQEVADLVNENLKAGNHEVTFNASRFASGVYFYRIVAGSFVSTKKMLLLK